MCLIYGSIGLTEYVPILPRLLKVSPYSQKTSKYSVISPRGAEILKSYHTKANDCPIGGDGGDQNTRSPKNLQVNQSITELDFIYVAKL